MRDDRKRIDRWVKRAVGKMLVAGLLGIVAVFAAAQDYPTRPVRVIVPNAAGSLNDSLARLVFAKLSQSLGQQFVVDNRVGGGGIIAAEAVARAAPDGYTLLASSNSVLVVNPFLFPKLGYDPLRDFEPITLLAKVSEVLVVNPALGAKTVEEFVRLAKAQPGRISYASGGNGHPTHLMMELFQRKAGIQLLHVPFKGTSPAMQAMAAGEVDAFNIGIGLARPHITSGKVIALAKTGFPSKDALGGIAPLTASYPEAEYIPTQLVVAPRGTPADVVAKLNAEIGRALALADIRERMMNLDMTATPSTPPELERTIRGELDLHRELIKAIGLKNE